MSAWDAFTLTPESRVCVIGAGLCGITCAQALKVRGIPFDMYEKGSYVGGLWRYENDNGLSSAYESLFINTSKKRMQYRIFPMPDDYPHYLHHTQLAEYSNDYVDYFGLRDDIRFRTEVTQVSPAEDGEWEVTTSSGSCLTYAAVAICNGHHCKPRWPQMPGHFTGQEMHSHDYRTSDGFEGKQVVVVGFGNSAVDIAVETSRVSGMTYLSVHRGAHVIPKFVKGKPTDHLSTPLTTRLPWAVRRIIQYRPALKVINGDLTKFGLPIPDHKLGEAHPTISHDLLSRIGHGRITPMPGIAELLDDKVRFVDGKVVDVDAIIYGTGYDIVFPFISSDILTVEDNKIQLYQRMIHPDTSGLFFIGLVDVFGAIQPVAEAQAGWMCDVLQSRIRLPNREGMQQAIIKTARKMEKRFVPSPRHTIQIDTLPYMRALENQRRGGHFARRRPEVLYPIAGGDIKHLNNEVLMRRRRDDSVASSGSLVEHT
ncbi:MAG: flavin-containing monooxygenase [Solirubrobacteraceae bacterium]